MTTNSHMSGGPHAGESSTSTDCGGGQGAGLAGSHDVQRREPGEAVAGVPTVRLRLSG